jgi:hypothetical protein
VTQAAPRDRPRWIDWLVVLLAIEAVATAGWLVPASIHIVEWPASGPVRLALLLPAWELLAVGALALAVALVLVARGTRASRWAPLLLLWLWVVPYLPWLPDRLPLLLVLAGPARWMIAAIAAAQLASRTAIWSTVSRRILASGRTTVLVASIVLYVGCGLWTVRANGLIGDEPHYLVITQSLIEDGDLRIENNHRQGDYRAYFSGNLRPDFMQRGQDGAIYSIHAPGLPVLVLPAYALAGYRGAIVFIAWLAALAALAVFDLADRLAGRRAAVLTWLAVCVTVPFIPYAWSIFPEMPGALLVAWAVLWLWEETDRSPRVWLWRGTLMAALPWLHTKFVVFLAIFAAAFLVRLWRRRAALAAWLTPIGVSGLAWLYSFYVIYGVADPEAPYGAYTSTYVLTQNIPHGLIGILFDQKFGLLFYSPIYLAAMAGAWLLVRNRRSRFPAIVLILTVTAFVVSTARLYMFWGGSSAPARFLVPILPCLAPMVALAIAHARRGVAHALVGVWVAIGLGVAAAALGMPDRLVLFSNPHGHARILEMLQAGSPLASVIPTFTDPDWTSHVRPLAAWLGVAFVSCLVAAAVSRVRLAGAWSVAFTATLLFVAGGAILTARPTAAVRIDTVRRGDLAVLDRFDGDRFRTLDYRHLARASVPEFQDLTTITIDAPETVPESGEVTDPVTLPPGRYEVRVWFAGAQAREGEVLIDSRNEVTFAQRAGRLQNPTTVAVDLPLTVRRFVVRVRNPQVASAVRRVEIVPRAVVPPPGRDDRQVRKLEPIPGRAGAYLAYMDEHAYPEAGTFWTRGTAATRVLVAPADASRMTLRLFTGPMSGTDSVRVGEDTRSVTMAENDANEVSFRLPPGLRLVPLTVQSSVMFRPGEVDAESRDMRGLGCQVHIILD